VVDGLDGKESVMRVRGKEREWLQSMYDSWIIEYNVIVIGVL
jgi:hypothetical protein